MSPGAVSPGATAGAADSLAAAFAWAIACISSGEGMAAMWNTKMCNAARNRSPVSGVNRDAAVAGLPVFRDGEIEGELSVKE